MSNHHVVAAVSRTIRRLLWEGMKSDPAVRSVVKSERAIIVGPPTSQLEEARLSIWLYQVRPNLYLADQPMRHITDVAAPPPLPLDLAYMITPILPPGDQDGTELVVLARAMQIMAGHAHIDLSEPGFEESLRVMLEDPPLEDKILLWRALRAPMRASAFYKVSTVRIDPLERNG